VLRARFAEVFLTKTRDEWCALLEGTDACFAPVLDMVEARKHAHMAARNIHLEVDGVVNPAPAPRFSRTPAATPEPAMHPGADTAAVLARWGFGFGAEEIARLKAAGVSS
jgi:alpha-methylacyl-CoA racemase